MSVVVCAYKIGKKILPTLYSILGQTFTNFELIIIDDASGDGTGNAIGSVNDPRVQLVTNPYNLGIVANRNHGNELARGVYIAHCDHDDIWERTKLEKQVVFLDTHPEYGIASTKLAKYLNAKQIADSSPLPNWPSPNEIRWSLLLDSTFAHSAILYRASVVREHGLKYSENYTFADDWDFFTRMCKVSDPAILPEPLTQYHLGEENWSILAAETMISGGARLLCRELSNLLSAPISEEQARFFFGVCISGVPCESRRQLFEIGDILFAAHAAFEASNNLSEMERKNIRHITVFYWWKILKNAANRKGPGFLSFYIYPGVPDWLKIDIAARAKASLVAIAKSIQRLYQP